MSFSSTTKLPFLSGTASQLKNIAFSLGLPTTGTKSELQHAIQHRLSEARSFGKGGRIVSIDMGIKNLGICVLEAPHLADSMPSIKKESMDVSSIKIVAWKTMNVLNQFPLASRPIGTDTSTTADKQDHKVTAFGPSLLSKSAVSVARYILQTYNPSQILIERQRYRSGGMAAVQEWTLRVNSLESMLWACLETLRQSTQGKPELYEVNPQRVAKFWCAPPPSDRSNAESAESHELPSPELETNVSDTSGRTRRRRSSSPKVSERKIDKKQKISVARSWLSQDLGLDSHQRRFDLSDEAQTVADRFLSGTTKRKKTSVESRLIQDGEPAKIDDLADCLLQGVAWVQWEENRRRAGHSTLIHPSID